MIMQKLLAVFILSLLIQYSVQISIKQHSRTQLPQGCLKEESLCAYCKDKDENGKLLFITEDHRCVTTCPLDTYPDQDLKRCVQLQHDLNKVTNLTCPKSFFINDQSCICPDCKECTPPLVCLPGKCNGPSDCCCPKGSLYWEEVTSTGTTIKNCGKQCPTIDFCQIGSVCVHHKDVVCPEGYYKDITDAPNGCCKPCKDPCCQQCDASGKCLTCFNDKNPLNIIDSYQTIKQIQGEWAPCIYGNSSDLVGHLPKRDFSQCSCCKQFSGQCHCDFCQNDYCHQNHPECPICPDDTYDIYLYAVASSKDVKDIGRCHKCHKDCLKCFGPTEQDCIICAPGKTLRGTECVSDCGPGYFVERKNCSCLKHQLCECPYQGFYPNEHQSEVIHKNSPISGTVNKDPNPYQYCELCHENCASCIGPGINQCLTCKSYAVPFGANDDGTFTCIKPSGDQINNQSSVVAANDMHYVFLLDESGSMGGPSNPGSYWEQLIAALDGFLSVRKSLNKNDLISVITYSSSAKIQFNRAVLSSFSTSQISFSGGGTNFGAGLTQFINLFPTPEKETISVVMSFMSDGVASTPTTQLNQINSNNALKSLILRCWVTAIGSSASTTALQTIASDLGGQFQPYTSQSATVQFYKDMATH